MYSTGGQISRLVCIPRNIINSSGPICCRTQISVAHAAVRNYFSDETRPEFELPKGQKAKPKMNNKPILYSYFRSSCSWRVRMALAFKGIEYETRAVNLLKDEQLNPEFLKLNPSAQVPAFVSKNGQTITQSIAIMEYLEEEYPENRLLPIDSASRAKVREVCAAITAGIQPIQNLAVMKKISDEEAERHEWARYWIEKGFEALEALFVRHSGKYSVGDSVTLADCCLLPQVFNAIRFKVDMSRFPTISRVNETLSNLEVFKPCHPKSQADCPPNLKA